MVIKAHAKVNLIMNVLGVREDGYHEVETLMQTIDLHDTLEISTSKGTGICIKSSGLPMNCGPSNLMYKAASLMLKTFDKMEHIEVTIKKCIPIAAGLGGGSADAAAVINGLAEIWGIDDKDKLLEIGSLLGSDVPFCIAAGWGKTCAIGRGTGTELEFINTPSLKVELKVLDIHIQNKTKKVYEELKPEDYAIKYDIQKFLNAKTIEEKDALLGNHLQTAAIRVFKNAGFGIPDEPKHLSGAGPTLFKLIE